MPTKIVVPELGESVVEATVGAWRKQEGDRVSVGDILVELETEKVDLEVGAEHGGLLARIERQEGDNVQIGDLLGVIEEARRVKPRRPRSKRRRRGKAGAANGEGRTSPRFNRSPGTKPGRKLAGKRLVTPLAKRLAEEHGVDLSRSIRAAGGPHPAADVESYLQGNGSKTAAAPTAGPETAGRPEPGAPPGGPV